MTSTFDGASKPLAIDLFCGLGGWTEGLLAEGYYVVGFDIEKHEYGDAKYPAQLVLQSVLTLHGRQFKDAALIVASPPCQEFSYMAMPWSKAKAKERDLLEGRDDPKRLTALFDACFRIQREACEAAGRHIPLVVENVRGAQKWVGRSRWAFGSFHLWGDVPALMPMTKRAKVGGFSWSDHGKPDYKPLAFNGEAERRLREDIKNTGGSWFAIGSPGQKETGRNPVHEHVKSNPGTHERTTGPGRPQFIREDIGVKQAGISGVRENGKGDRWFQDGAAQHGSKSNARKAASAAIAKIPFALAQHIARTYKPVASP